MSQLVRDTQEDQERLRVEYADREQRLAQSDAYSAFNLAHLFMIQSRQRAMLRVLRKKGFYPLADKTVLEVGCGYGGNLLEMLWFGASPHLMHGIELLPDRITGAHHRLPHLPLMLADGQRLPFDSESFDLVMQFTVFSSILDDQIKANIAQEMLRVVRKPGGVILWYDFWLNPTNPQTRGIRLAEIRRLFPGCKLDVQKITLAPPLLRRLVGLSWILCSVLEKIGVFNTHYLVAISPKQG